MSRRVVLLALLGALVGPPDTAVGDEPPAQTPEEQDATSPLVLARELVARANAAAAKGRHKDAIGDFRNAVKLLREHGGDDERLAAALHNLGVALKNDGQRSEALSASQDALVILRRLHPGDHEDVSMSLHSTAQLLVAAGKPREALPLFREALEMRRRLFSGDHRLVAQSLSELALVLTNLGRATQALPLMEASLAMGRRLWRGDHPTVAGSLNNLALVLLRAGRARQAVKVFEECVAMVKRLFPGDHPRVALSLGNLASLLLDQGKANEALAHFEASLAMSRRLFPGDHARVASGLGGKAQALRSLGRHRESLPILQESLAMTRRLFGDHHPRVASILTDLAHATSSDGRAGEALTLFREAAGLYRRSFPGDHPDVAQSLTNVALCLVKLGRLGEALPLCREALAMVRNVFPGDHPKVASALDGLGIALTGLGSVAEALPILRESLAMRRRLYGNDHPDVGKSLGHLAHVLERLGRAEEALPLFQASLATIQRRHAGDHPLIAAGMNGLAHALQTLGRPQDALPYYERSLAMRQRLSPGDHPEVARALNNMGYVLDALGKVHEAKPWFERALAMYRRLYPGDHPNVALALNNLAYLHRSLADHEVALPLFVESVDMRRRLFPDDHEEVASGLTNLAHALVDAGRTDEAKQRLREAIAMGERLHSPEGYQSRVLLGSLLLQDDDAQGAMRALEPAAEQLERRRSASASLGSEGRTRYLSALRRWDPFPLLVRAHLMAGEPAKAFAFLERSRGREMLDLLERGRGDPLQAARALAVERGDPALQDRIAKVERTVRDAAARMATAQGAVMRAGGDRRARKRARAQERDARRAHEDALRARLAIVRDVIPQGRPLEAFAAQALLRHGDVCLSYALGEHSFVFVMTRDDITAHALTTNGRPVAAWDVANVVRRYRALLETSDGRSMGDLTAPGAALFQMLLPPRAWKVIRQAGRVFVLPHRALHQLPFEALVVARNEDQPVFWPHEGPPIAYAASASVLAALQARAKHPLTHATILAVGDPVFEGASGWPEQGVVIQDVAPDSQAAALELRRGDVITSYAGQPTPSYEALRSLLADTDGRSTTASLGYEREGVPHEASLRPGRIGVVLAREKPPVAGPKLLQQAGVGVLRATTRGRLVPLPGTRAEVDAIASLVRNAAGGASMRVLLGADATEAGLFGAAQSPRVLHLATHGLIEPRKGARASRLALTPPRVPVPGNDGFLSLGDLLEHWRTRLQGTQLVVLSACESHMGALDDHEGMLALPWGFCFAGARSCIASLWQVDDESTAQLMTSLYRRLLKGSSLRPCEALHAARRDLMTTHPDPYHWAAFVFVGAP